MIKYHYPYEHVAGGPPHKSPAKYIYSYRNPRDVAVSLFLLHKSLESVRPPVWHFFLDDFISGNVAYGCQLDHIKGWWEHKGMWNGCTSVIFRLPVVYKQCNVKFVSYRFS